MATNTDLTQVSATELVTLMDSGEVTSTEITEQVLARIAKLNPIVGAFVTVTEEIALENAKASDARRAKGESLSAIDGIPYSIKDLENTAGIRTTLGSKFFEHNVPTEDSAIAGILRGSGGVLLGKTNTPHMGYKDMCDNYIFPSALNPWDTSTTPGGSSGGAGAAIAAGLGPLAQGGDGAGSIRIPAGLTGTVGFKGTFGRVPFYPVNNPWSHRIHNGPITRTVADAALMFSVMTRFDVRDPQSVKEPLAPFSPLEGAQPLAGRKALLLMDFGYGFVHSEVIANTRAAVAALEDLGVEVTEKDVAPWTDPAGFHAVLYAGGGIPAAFLEHLDWIESDLLYMLEAGGKRTALEISKAEADRGIFHQQLVDVMTEYDYIITPTMPLPAWSAVPGPGPDNIEGTPIDRYSKAFLVYPFNLSGQPAISIPSGFSSEGLPTGVQIVGRKYEDIEVLQAAAALESVLDLNPAWPTPTVRPEGLDGVIATK